MANGVPALLNQVANVTNKISLIVADVGRIRKLFRDSGWGIYDKYGEVMLVPDSISALDYQHNYEILTYPVEEGGFQSYNKVQLPFETSVEMTKGGSEKDRTEFIAALERFTRSLTLVNVVTPEQTFFDVNIDSFDYSRTATNGIGLMTFNVHFKEVRSTVTRTTKNTKNPNSKAPTQTGTVQAAGASAPVTA